MFNSYVSHYQRVSQQCHPSVQHRGRGVLQHRGLKRALDMGREAVDIGQGGGLSVRSG
jgi:hypothetical protein